MRRLSLMSLWRNLSNSDLLYKKEGILWRCRRIPKKSLLFIMYVVAQSGCDGEVLSLAPIQSRLTCLLCTTATIRARTEPRLGSERWIPHIVRQKLWAVMLATVHAFRVVDLPKVVVCRLWKHRLELVSFAWVYAGVRTAVRHRTVYVIYCANLQLSRYDVGFR